jgi:hypothetical protein
VFVEIGGSQEKRSMKADSTAPTNIDKYIARFPRDVQEILRKIRPTIKKAALRIPIGLAEM